MNTTQDVQLSLIDIPACFREHTLESVDALAQDIQRNGQLQEIVIMPKGDGRYELVAGKRRTLAMRHLNKETVRAQVMENLSERRKALIMIAENDEREDVNPFDRALSYQRALNAEVTQRELAEQLGTSEKVVSDVLRCLKLAPQVTEDLRRRKFSGAKVTELTRLPDAENQLKMADACDKAGWSSKVLRDKVARVLAGNSHENGDVIVKPPRVEGPFQFIWKGNQLLIKGRLFSPHTENLNQYQNEMSDAYDKFMEAEKTHAKAA